MDKGFREHLSFKGLSHPLSQRENWAEALALLPDSTTNSPLQLNLPTTVLEDTDKIAYLEWVLMEDSCSTSVILVPYFVDGISSYRIPSFTHLFTHLNLSPFDKAWVNFFANHFYHEDARIVLDSGQNIQAILWTLAQAKRLRLVSDNTLLEPDKPLQLKARLRYSEELILWALDAELITETGEIIAPEYLDLITSSPCGL